VKTPSPELAERLLAISEQALHSDPALRLEDIARLVGTSRAALYYYFSGRDDLLSFLLTTHARHGAEAIQAAIDPDDPPPVRLRAMLSAMIEYLGGHPGTCAGLLSALGATGQMGEVLRANDTWIAAPLRDLLLEGRASGAFAVHDIGDAANAVLGAILLAVLGRTMAGADPTDRRFRQQLTEQIIRGLLAA
jgi:TetR/AcrR family transcriptional regulator